MATDFVAQHSGKLAYPAYIVYNEWKYCNADCCVNINDDSSMSNKNFVNFGPVTPEISWLICVGGEST